MNAWLRALFSQVIISLWWMLSAASTLSTFFFHGWAGKVRPVLAVSSVVGFAWANYKVFQEQQSQISTLRERVQSHPTRAPDLRIVPQDGSRYILRRVQNVAHADFRGIYLEFQMMIENRGQRNSTVNDFQVEIVELNRTFTHLMPQEGLNTIQGRHCVYGVNAQRGLSETGLIKVEPENTTNRATLILYVPDVDLGMFAECNLRMDGPERRFPQLHCRLTLTDTTRVSASETFEMHEG